MIECVQLGMGKCDENAICQVGQCENEATHWGKMCDEHAKERTGHPDRIMNKNGEI